MVAEQAHAGSDADVDVHDDQKRAASVSSRGFIASIANAAPFFLWIALISIGLRVIEAIFGVSILKENIFPVGDARWSVTTMELLLVLLSVFGFVEALRVSRPGVDQSLEVWAIVILGIIQLMAFVLGTFAWALGEVPWMHVFATSENAFMALITMTCSFVSYRLNVRSMQRSFVNN